jgi:hypothetical protein
MGSLYKTREEVFEAWLQRVCDVGECHGQILFSMLLDFGQGRFFVDSSDADRLLRKAEEEGRIVHMGGPPEPTFSQRLAGIGGESYRGTLTYLHLFSWKAAPHVCAKCGHTCSMHGSDGECEECECKDWVEAS